MPQFRLLAAVVVALTFASIASAELPTADEILQIHRENQHKLSRLHLQLVQMEESTEAEAANARKSEDDQAKFFEAATKMLKSKIEDVELQFDGKTLKGEEAREILTQLVADYQRNNSRGPRQERKAFRMFTPMEFFLNGDDYQFRQSVTPFMSPEKLAEWKFQDIPLTANSLSESYHETMIFSRSHLTDPPSRWWSPSRLWHGSSVCNAYVTRKHLCEVTHVQLPPYTDLTGSRWDSRHGYDHFFSQSADKYRVIRQDEFDGRQLTVVDVDVPIDPDSKSLLCYRAWLDLKRGAIPIKLFHSAAVGGEIVADRFDSRDPSEITETHELRELSDGAFYPTKVVLERWDVDRNAPELTQEEAEELRTGKRKVQRVVHRRRTWECSRVDVDIQFNESFFVLPFSAKEKIYDYDAEKMLGALETKPVPKIGQQAPPLTIAHWMDGRKRTLDDLKGQVVVLNFWGLWCSACRNEVATLKVIQEKFRDQPVVFIAIHSAERDAQALAKKIAEFQKENGWNVSGEHQKTSDAKDAVPSSTKDSTQAGQSPAVIGQSLSAIDSGRMVEDSVTTTAYGVSHFPFQVVIGPDGKIVYADPDNDGPSCDEKDPIILAAFQKVVQNYWELRFKTVGEAWPLDEKLNDQAQVEIYDRVQLKYFIHVIESALPGQ